MPRKRTSKPKGRTKCMKGSVKNTKFPRYNEMVRSALTNIKQATGLTNKDILEYLLSNYGLSETKKVNRALEVALKSGIRNGSLIKIDNKYQLVFTTGGKQQSRKLRLEGKEKETVKAVAKSSAKIIIIPKRTSKPRASTTTKELTRKKKMITTDNPHPNKRTDDKSENDISNEDDDFDISKLTAHCYCSQYCRIPGDKDICQIEGIDVIPERRTMIVLDSNNKNIKVFDSMVYFRASYSFDYSEYGPKAMSVLNTEEVVVSVYAQTQPLWTRLIILNIKGKEISHVHTIPIEGLVIRAIACHREKIFIAGNDVRRTDGAFVKFIDRDGKSYWSTAMKDNSIKNASPGYMTCFPDQGGLAVVVIDVSNNKLWKYDGSTGDLLWCDEKGHFRGLTSGGGLMFVCSTGYKDIYALTKTLRQVVVVRGKFVPLCIKYDSSKTTLEASKHKLLVSSHCEGRKPLSNYVDFYELK